jgi:hypothetical protein
VRDVTSVRDVRDVGDVSAGRGNVRDVASVRDVRDVGDVGAGPGEVRDVGNVGNMAGRLHRSTCTLVPGTGTQDGAECLKNARTLGTLKRKVVYLSSGRSASFQITGSVLRSLEVTLEVTVKVTVPILTASAPRT